MELRWVIALERPPLFVQEAFAPSLSSMTVVGTTERAGQGWELAGPHSRQRALVPACARIG